MAEVRPPVQGLAWLLTLFGRDWPGDNSSVMKKVIERLYPCSSVLNSEGQFAYYGRVGGRLITGNEDGAKHCAMNVLYSLQHLGCTSPLQADAGWVGEAGPSPSYLDDVLRAQTSWDACARTG
jgi:multimeric flavodoxin WrbA